MAVKDLGVVTAYGYAVAGGYAGTEEEFTALLGDLANTVEDLEGMTAEADTLTPGQQATASYSDGVLSLGIPAGNGIASIELTSTSGNVKTYTINFTNGTTTSFNVTDGEVTMEVLNQAFANLGLSVVDGMLNVTYEV